MLKNIIIGYINVNSIQSKFDDVNFLLNSKVDIYESKLDNSFPSEQFCMSGYNKPFRLDVSDKSGGLLVYIL